MDSSVPLSIRFLLGFRVVLLSALLLVVSPLHLLQFSRQPLDLILVLVDLRLVHVEFGCHGLHLVGLLLQVLLVDGQLFSDFGAGLTSKQVFEFDVEFLFFLDDDVLLNNLLGLLNQSLLECLDLLEHLPSVGISALEFPPAVAVERVFEFLRKRFDTETFGEQLLVEVDDFVAEVVDLAGLGTDNPEFALEVSNRVVKDPDVFKSLLVLVLALAEGGLQDLDLLV